MIERTYFVYLHRRQDTGEVFYVGKGTRTPLKQYIRANTTNRRNIFWKRIVAKAGYDVEVVADFFREADAFTLEQQLIAQYKRSVDGGTLCNLTSGGEGHSGLSPSQETRRKMSEKAKGKAKPDHVRIAVSAAQRGIPNSPEQNAEHSRRMSGAGNPWYGKNRTDSFVEKISGWKSSQSKNVTDGINIYPSIKEAATVLGVRRDTLSRWLHGAVRNQSTMRFA